MDWFVTERERDEYRKIDREGESGYGEIEEREQEIRKYGRERERERARIKRGKMGWLRGNNKIIENFDYLNKRGYKIDELMWVFCKSDGVK